MLTNDIVSFEQPGPEFYYHISVVRELRLRDIQCTELNAMIGNNVPQYLIFLQLDGNQMTSLLTNYIFIFSHLWMYL